MNKKIVLVCLLSFFVAAAPAAAAEINKKAKEKCPDTFPNLVTDICWKCFFPIRLGGKTINNFGDMKDEADSANSDAYTPNNYVCQCAGKDWIPEFGTMVSLWDPVSVIEVIQRPGCFSFLFGSDMNDTMSFFGAHGGRGGTDDGDKAFYNVHLYAFPLMSLLEFAFGTKYCVNWYDDIDIAFFTEADPTWANDELGIFLTPEAVLFANPVAQALGAVDCLAATAGFPLNPLFWTAGCWGPMYPFTGNTGLTGSPVRETSLLAARLLARLTRIPVPPAVEMDTSSAGTECKPKIRTLIKKSQYKFSTLFPIRETSGKCCHTLGSSTFLWGEFRNIPGTGEFQTYMTWKKKNCCLIVF